MYWWSRSGPGGQRWFWSGPGYPGWCLRAGPVTQGGVSERAWRSRLVVQSGPGGQDWWSRAGPGCPEWWVRAGPGCPKRRFPLSRALIRALVHRLRLPSLSPAVSSCVYSLCHNEASSPRRGSYTARLRLRLPCLSVMLPCGTLVVPTLPAVHLLPAPPWVHHPVFPSLPHRSSLEHR